MPAWIGSILTGGGVLVAALVYRQEHRDRIRKAANAVYVEVRTEAATAIIHNDSPEPVFMVKLLVQTDDDGPGTPIEGLEVLPSQQAPHVQSRYLNRPRGTRLEFTDQNDRRWVREISGEKAVLRQIPHPTRWTFWRRDSAPRH